MSQEPVRFGIVSPARWGRKLLDAVRESDALRFVGVCSRDAQNAADIVTSYGGRAYASYDTLLSDPVIEAVVLPTPDFLHYPQVMAAFEAGKHVFVEKPIATTLSQAQEMQAASTARDLVLAVGLQLRRTGAARMVRRMLDEGVLGEPVMVVATHGAPILRNRPPDSWLLDPDKVPGGPLDQLGVHYADLLCYWFGPIRWVSGTCTRGVSPTGVIDAASAIFEFESGLIGSYTTHQVSVYSSNCSVFGTQAAVHFRRAGQELFWEDITPPADAKRDGPQLRQLTIDGPHPFTTALREELEDFARAIRTGGTPEVGAAEGIAALRVVRAIMQSCADGSRCAINAPGES